MKNKIRKLLLTMCAVTTAFALSACGGGSKAPADDTAQAEDDAAGGDTAGEEAPAEEEEPEVSGKYASIQEFVDSDIMKEELASQMESLEDSGMTMELKGEDNKLIYNFIIEDESLSKLLSTQTESLESTLDSQASTYSAVAASLTAAIDVEDPVVVVQYSASDGTVIISKEYAASSADDAADTTADTADAAADAAADAEADAEAAEE